MLSTNYVVIQGWMCNELELKGNELLTFALIYGFSQDGQTKFYGSRNYIAETFNISLPTVDKALESLENKNLIERTLVADANGQHYECEVCKETLHRVVKFLYGGSKETLLNNTSKQTKKENKTNSKELVQDFEFGKPKAKKQNLFTSCVSLIDEFTKDTQIRIDLTEYLKLLLEMKKDGYNLYTNTWKGLLRKLQRLSDDPVEQHEIICQSIERSYKSFFPVNNYSKSFKNESGARHVPTMTEEDYIRQEEYLRRMDEEGVQVRF